MVHEVAKLVRSLRDEETSVLVVEQNMVLGLHLAQVCYFISQGEFVRQGAAAEIERDDEVMAAYLGAS